MTMEIGLILIISLLFLGFAIVIWFINKKLTQEKSDDSQQALTEWLKSTQSDIKDLQSTLTKTLQQSDKNVTDTLQKSYQELNQRLDNAAKVIGELKEETGKFSEIGRSMKELQAFLNSPKARGNLGEQVLKDLIDQMLPHQAYSTQYRFKSGDIVDAVIKTRAGLISIDSKFPMENYTKMVSAESKKETSTHQKQFQNDVRKHVRDISKKYIRTNEGTLDFALMYLPSESIYYEIMTNNPEIYDYSLHNRVLPVSPSTFYAFLQTVLVSFEGQRIAKEAQVILSSLRDIQKSTGEFGEKLGTLSKHITNAHNNMGHISTDFTNLKNKIDSTRQIRIDEESDNTKLINE